MLFVLLTWAAVREAWALFRVRKFVPLLNEGEQLAATVQGPAKGFCEEGAGFWDEYLDWRERVSSALASWPQDRDNLKKAQVYHPREAANRMNEYHIYAIQSRVALLREVVARVRGD